MARSASIAARLFVAAVIIDLRAIALTLARYLGFAFSTAELPALEGRAP